jgi:hypothetical protein
MKVLLSCCTSYYYFSIKMALACVHYKHKLILHYCIKKMLVVIAFTWQVHMEFLSFYKDALHGKTGQKSPWKADIHIHHFQFSMIHTITLIVWPGCQIKPYVIWSSENDNSLQVPSIHSPSKNLSCLQGLQNINPFYTNNTWSAPL